MSGKHRLVQLADAQGRRLLCKVEEPVLRVVNGYASVYDLARAALAAGRPLTEFLQAQLGVDAISYDAVYNGRSDLHFLPAIDHPSEPARCLVSGTGLTHQRSVDTRQSMHAADETVTDSMRMYELGVAGGRPEPGAVGVSPEWFYKGNGFQLRGHNWALDVPCYAEDGGEEPEVAGVYLIDDKGNPRRVGMATGNEFADHKLERRNYLYLAASKMRACALGPELVIDPDFDEVNGVVAIERNGDVIWSRAIRGGEAAMCHSLANIEHHHFKYEAHRQPGDVHVHFLGADAFSFGSGIELHDGDVMQVAYEGFGRPLRNALAVAREPEGLVRALPV